MPDPIASAADADTAHPGLASPNDPHGPPVTLRIDGATAIVELNGPDRRNALDERTIGELERTLDALALRADVRVIVLHGVGAAFCAGFDLTRVVSDPPLMSGLIGGLSRLIRRLRQRDQATVAAVHGAALAGGCALATACDVVVVAPDATLGYPVHRIGVSPAVSAPTASAALGGNLRSVMLGGEIVDGTTAVRLGLATHLARSAETVFDEAMALARRLADKGPVALRTTKAWLNEIDGTADPARFDESAAASAAVCGTEESVRLLESFWLQRQAGHGRAR